MILRLTAIASVVACAVAAAAPPLGPGQVPFQWDKETLDLFSTLPIQDGGRVKPLSTFAAFTMLKLNGKRFATLPAFRTIDAETGEPEEKRVSPMEWMLDCLFFPRAAEHYRTFVVEDAAVLDAIGVPHEGRDRFDHYSYAELEPGLGKLFELAEQYRPIDDKEKTPVQGQIVELASNVFLFRQMALYLDFARHDFSIQPGSPLAAALSEPTFSGILKRAKTLQLLRLVLDEGIESLQSHLSPEEFAQIQAGLPEGINQLDEAARKRHMEDVRVLAEELQLMATRASGLALLPPGPGLGEQEDWLTAGDVAMMAFAPTLDVSRELDTVAALERMARATDNVDAFKAELAKLHQSVVGLAKSRGEYGKVPLEVSFYRWKFFFWGLWLYVLAFAGVAVTWLFPFNARSGKWFPVMLVPPTTLLIAGIVVRCIIRGRPPVSTLYETILFITAVAVVVAMLIELMNRQKIALSVGAVLGMAGMFLANRFEVQQGVDTMPSLQAVLDTNFWLSTHVTSITMGYAAGLLAGFIAHIYILGRLIGLKKGDPAFYKNVARMTYGVLCFGLLFAVVGTVLGGIWANESWGRFWGWDPKENGALMIVLWELAILHGRMGGYIRDLGVAAAAVFGNIVVAFSWWGVNLLGVGLHSYGFTSGILPWLLSFYVLEGMIVLLGIYVWLRDPASRRAHSAPAPAPAAATAAGRRKTRRTLPAKASK
jgi:ABC-type transport system involved in cytochrome c biogenesis permease subunit